MIVQCRDECHWFFDDEFRSTLCPHDTFWANDGHNNFSHHPESYLSPVSPDIMAAVTKLASELNELDPDGSIRSLLNQLTELEEHRRNG